MSLQSISTFCGSSGNVPGLYTIEYAPTTIIDAGVYTQGVENQIWVTGIPFSQGSWLQLPVYYRPDQLWTQQQNDTQQGRSYANVVAGTTPNMRPAVEEQFEAMADYAFLLRLKDRNGKYWLLGTLEHPFYFQADSSSGNRSGANQYSIQFSSVLPHRVFGLDL